MKKVSVHLLIVFLIIGAFAPWNPTFAENGKNIRIISYENPKWSPDGKKIAFIATLESKEIRKDSAGNPYEVSLTAFNILVFELSNSNLKAVVPFYWQESTIVGTDVDTRRPKKLKVADYPGGYKPPTPAPKPIIPLVNSKKILFAFGMPYSWSPDSTKIIFFDSSNSGSSEDEIYIWVANSDGTGVRYITKTSGGSLPSSSCLQWLKTGKIIYKTRTDNKLFYQINPDGTFAGQIVVRENYCTTNHYFSGDGKMVALALDGDIWIYKTATMTKFNLTKTKKEARRDSSDYEYNDLSFSPNDKKLAFVFFGTRAFNGHRIWIIGTDGSDCRPLTEVRPMAETTENTYDLVTSTDKLQRYYEEYSPSWSPDGKMIVYIRTYQNKVQSTSWSNEIWMMNSDGSGHREVSFKEVKEIEGLEQRLAISKN